MDIISKNVIRALIDKREGTCISLFMPTHGSGGGAQQNLIRFKNLLRKAGERLASENLRPQEIKDLLDPAMKLLEDHTFWLHQSSGFAMFLSRETFLFWRLPIVLNEIVVVTGHFYLKPLLPLLNHGGQFYILALSRSSVGLYHATRSSITQIDMRDVQDIIPGMLRSSPAGISRRIHAAAPASAGRRAGMHHGSGPGPGESKENLLRCLRLIDRRVGELIRDRHMPLIVAGVEELFPLYRTVNTLPNLVDDFIAGSPDSLGKEEIHERALAIMEAQLRREQSEVVEQCVQAEAAGHASTDIRKIVEAAYRGRIELLVIADGMQQWGTFDTDTNEVQIHARPQPVDEDLLDFAAMHAMLSGAAVYTVEAASLPDRKPAAALLRY